MLPVQRELVDKAWRLVGDMLAKDIQAKGDGRFLEDIRRSLAQGQRQLFLIIQGTVPAGAIIAGLDPHRGGRSMTCHYVAGTVSAWLDRVLADLEAWGKRHGCEILRIALAPRHAGLARALELDTEHVLYRRELGE